MKNKKHDAASHTNTLYEIVVDLKGHWGSVQFRFFFLVLQFAYFNEPVFKVKFFLQLCPTCY